jgi:hypothetical protein
MSKPVNELLPSKPDSRLRIYAWSTDEIPRYKGCLKIGQTTIDVRDRVIQSQGQSRYRFKIEVEQFADRPNGTFFTDHEVRRQLRAKGFENVELEWMRCSADEVLTAITELRNNISVSGTHHLTFKMRPEQEEAVHKTVRYFRSIWALDADVAPRFLWNAKMRFGKTFAAYQLAKELNAMKVLVLTFKPAVEDAWKDDLESHADFDTWQYLSRATSGDPTTADKTRPLVYFGSFQDLLGKDKLGNIKANNEWLHETSWDLVIFDEYHFGAWRENVKELFEGEDEKEARAELADAYNPDLDNFNEELDELGENEQAFLPITTKAYLYLSGTPFKALASGEFIEEQLYNWTYTDEQRAKQEWDEKHPGEPNPYLALPEMRLFTYQMPDELVAIASQGEFDEFDLNAFFAATGKGANATFKYKNEVQKWLDIIRGSYSATQTDYLKLAASKPPFPYSDVRLLPYMQHSFWFFYSEASCHAMKNLLAEKQNAFFHEYEILSVAGTGAGVGLNALPPVRKAIGNGYDTKSITLSCGKLSTGVTIPQWSSILMLRNLQSPETYFQAAFRVQSPWSIENPNGDNPNEELIVKPACFVFDFAPTRALRQIASYGAGLNPDASNPEDAVRDLVNFLPVLAYDGSHMTQIDAGGVLDIAMAGTSATLLARKWESALLVNVDNDTLRKIVSNPEAHRAIMNIEGFRSLGDTVLETIVNKSEKVKETKREKGDDITPKERRELTAEEREYKTLRKQVQEKLIKFATRIPVFMYLTDFRENKLRDVITKIEPELFKSVTGLTVEDFNLLVSLNVFNSSQMNQAVFAFRRYEDASLSYTGINSHEGLTHIGLYDTVVAQEIVPS